MGIRGLLPFLRARAPDLAQPWTPTTPLRVAVDTAIFAHKFLYADGGMSAPRMWARFEGLIQRMASDRLLPTFVFDGDALQLKDGEHARRARAREEQAVRVARKRSHAEAEAGEEAVAVEVVGRGPPTVLRVTGEDYGDLWERMVAHGVPCLRARHEAEALCVHLVHEGDADAVITEDSDALAYQAPMVLFRYGTTDAYSMAAPAIHAALGLSAPEFQSFCILLGTDFSSRIQGVGPVAALALVRGRTAAQVLEHLRDAAGGGPRAEECSRALVGLPAVVELFETRCWEARRNGAAQVEPSAEAAAEGVTQFAEVPEVPHVPHAPDDVRDASQVTDVPKVPEVPEVPEETQGALAPWNTQVA